MMQKKVDKIWAGFPTFCGAFLDAKTLPKHDGLEIAVIGRSNVGKSSLLNALFNTKKLARVSQTPGCTKALMLFKVTEAFFVMDLPGYGFSKKSKEIQKQWLRAINSYFAHRRELSHIYVLIDSRRGLGPLDEEMLNYLNYYHLAHTCVLTKTDKSSKAEYKKAYDSVKKVCNIKSTNAYMFSTSSLSGDGLDALRDSIKKFIFPSSEDHLLDKKTE